MDFRHPFITNPKMAIYYGLFWLLAAAAYILVLTIGNGVDILDAVVQTFAFLISFAVIGTVIWYVIKFSTLENNGFWRIVLAHTIAASIIIFIWLYFGIVIIKLFHPVPSFWMDKQINRLYALYHLCYFFLRC